MSIKKGTIVRAGKGARIPARYQGRLGVVAGRAAVGSGRVQFLVNFPQRATALAVSATQLTPVS